MFRTTSFATLAAAALLGAATMMPAGAEAQGSNLCQGRVFVDAVYQNGLGGNRYEYFFHLRNQTGQRVRADVSFHNFPHDVTLFSPTLPNIEMGPWATVAATRFGNGTNGNIGNQTVRVVYDAAASHGATVRVTNCRAM